MQVLTFGVQVAEVTVDVETGEVTVDRIAAIHDVGRVINPLGASSQIEGGIIQGIGHTLSEERLTDPTSGLVLTQTLDAYRLPTIADVPEIVERADRRPRRAADEPRLEGPRRAADHPGRGRDRERDPRRDRRRRPLAADHARGDAAGARARPASERGAVQLRRPSSLATLDLSGDAVLLAGGTEVVPLLREGLLTADSLVDLAGLVPSGIDGPRIGAATTLAELEASAEIPAVLREACRLAASPQLRAMGTVGGNLLQSTRCWYWRLAYPCRLHGGDTCHARDGEHREHAIFGNDFCASAHPSDVAAALLALGATVRTDRRELPVGDLYRLPTPDGRTLTTLEPGEVCSSWTCRRPTRRRT